MKKFKALTISAMLTLGTSAIALAQETTTPASGTGTSTNAERVTDGGDQGFDLGWIGLIGLAGLFGLGGRRRNDHVDPATGVPRTRI